MSNAGLSIDVEDWFQVENLRAMNPPSSWGERELRVEANVDRILGLCAEREVTATFFVLGWVAERLPALIRRIADGGHEIACHGHGHELIYDLTPGAFREDVRRAKAHLEQVTGHAVLGYRAPSFSITDWAVDILRELGFGYDSSTFPTRGHDRYGKLTGVDGSRPILEIRPGLVELCVSALPVAGWALPWGGGGYFRLIPYPLFRGGIRRILDSGRPYVFYLHPWEIDPGQPRVDGIKAFYKFRHYVNLDRTEDRLRALLADFRWTTLADIVQKYRESPAFARGSARPL